MTPSTIEDDDATADAMVSDEWWMVVDKDRILEIAPGLAEALGYAESDIVGTRWERHIHAEDLASSRSAADSMGDRPLVGFVSRWRCADSSFLKLRWAATRWIPTIKEGLSLSPRSLVSVDPA